MFGKNRVFLKKKTIPQVFRKISHSFPKNPEIFLLILSRGQREEPDEEEEASKIAFTWFFRMWKAGEAIEP